MSLKIMVVDDEPKTSKLMRSLAVPLGHTVVPFEDYQIAREKGETQRFDLVFAGMRLPELDGIDVARRIRNSQLNKEAFIIMLSSSDDIESLRTAFREGADLVVAKPVSADRLRRMLTSMDFREWKRRRPAARLPLFTEVTCTWGQRQLRLRSSNISESGMLLQQSLDAEVGQEVSLEFEIAEIHTSLNMVGRIVRKEVASVGIEFAALKPEDRNAIQLYITGHLRDLTPSRDFSDVGMHRLFRP